MPPSEVPQIAAGWMGFPTAGAGAMAAGSDLDDRLIEQAVLLLVGSLKDR